MPKVTREGVTTNDWEPQDEPETAPESTDGEAQAAPEPDAGEPAEGAPQDVTASGGLVVPKPGAGNEQP